MHVPVAPAKLSFLRLPRRRLGVLVLAFGLLLLATAGAYYTYTFFASQNLDRLVYQTSLDAQPAETTLMDLVPSARPSTSAGAVGLQAPEPEAQLLYPGSLIPARQWADPRGTLDLGQEPLLAGFTPVSGLGQGVVLGSGANATRIIIPALGIDAEVEELVIQDLRDSSAYETPKFTVGHIPGTPNPGVNGNGWFFGHLESPLQGEGNVFSRLPQIPGLLKDGEDVYAITESEGRQYLYQVTETDLIHQDDIALYQADDARVTLVTCFPRLKYDQRLLITAKLVGFKDLS